MPTLKGPITMGLHASKKDKKRIKKAVMDSMGLKEKKKRKSPTKKLPLKKANKR